MMKYIITLEPEFHETKSWFLRHWSIRNKAEVLYLDENTDIGKIKNIKNGKLFFLPKLALPNLGAFNPFRKFSNYEVVICGNNMEEPFFIKGENALKNLNWEGILSSPQPSARYMEFQKAVHQLYHSNRFKRFQMDFSWNFFPHLGHQKSLIEDGIVNIYHLSIQYYKSQLEVIKKELYDWAFLNKLRFRNVKDYPEIYEYTGRNKIKCKKIAKNLGVTVPKTYQIVSKISQIRWNKLPPAYVIKPTHLDGARKVYAIHKGINIITNKRVIKKEIERDYIGYETIQFEKELNKSLKKYLTPKIIVEEFVPNSRGKYSIPIDYKCYVFHGELKFILVIDAKKNRKQFAFYDPNWERIPNHKYSTNTKEIKYPIKKPKFLEKLVKNAETIAESFRKKLNYMWEGDFLRIDFYANKNDVYFGEIAIFPNGGKGRNVSKMGSRLFAEYWLQLF